MKSSEKMNELMQKMRELREDYGEIAENLESLEICQDALGHYLEMVNDRMRRTTELPAPTAPPEPPKAQGYVHTAPRGFGPGFAEEPQAAEETAEAQGIPSMDKAYMEKLLQGSLAAFGDKLSDKLAGLIKGLAGTAGPVRASQLREIQSVAADEHIDMSSLFKYAKVESNLGEDGTEVKEKQSQSIKSNLDKLKQMRKGQ